jgi:hypothetical protein
MIAGTGRLDAGGLGAHGAVIGPREERVSHHNAVNHSEVKKTNLMLLSRYRNLCPVVISDRTPPKILTQDAVPGTA